ncbi:MAG: 39S ribosomal protein L46, mitochondrial [Cirrosporium novae-zelandiae]|nr:MAG: 39S ribosomal protein L46, mitochondrial [Cirrosporium novae-zelandiae]
MAAGSTGTRHAALLIRASSLESSICTSCRRSLLHKRHYAAAAAAAVAQSNSSETVTTPPSVTAESAQGSYRIQAGLVLSRPPQLTRDLTPFEKAFFLYQKRLNERLVLPFTRYFYISPKTPADFEWKRKIRERQTPARDIGVYNAYGKEGWNDEVLVGAKESEPEYTLEALLKDAEKPKGSEEVAEATSEKDIVERPLPRVTEADKKGDTKSLNRALQRTLYLLVKEKSGIWKFPTAGLEGKENLHEAAARLITQTGGPNMNTWVVGHVPIGHLVYRYPSLLHDSAQNVDLAGEKTFFMKARIMAGKPDLSANTLGLQDYQWLAKDEIQNVVKAGIWASIRHMLADR